METILRNPQQLFSQQLCYEIPSFQRRYVWKREDQWEPLFDDIRDLADALTKDGRREPHFMGAIVIQELSHSVGTLDRWIVIDGQQRLTTLQLLIDAIEEVLAARGHDVAAEQLELLVLNAGAYREKEDDQFKVLPSITDRDAFRAAMTNGQSTEGHADSPIVKAHEFFKTKAEDWLESFSDKANETKRALALKKAVSETLQMVVIDLGEFDEAQIIFETLNARGTPLLQSDMVKNKLLYDAEREPHPSSKHDLASLWPFEGDEWWNEESGRGIHRRPRIDSFLNDYFTLRNGTLTPAFKEMQAFEEYTKQHGRPVIEIAEDLARLAGYWREIEEVRPDDIATFARRKAMLGATPMPVVLALLSGGLDPKVRDRALKVVESYFVRRIMCGYQTRGLGKMFAAMLKPLEKAPKNRVDKVLAEELLKRTSVWPNDNMIRETLEGEPIYRRLTSSGTRIVLEAMEEKLREPYAKGEGIPTKLWVEHILPQAWGEHWPLDEHSEEAKLARERAVHMLGNLTLVTAELNIDISNGPWVKKREMLEKHSTLKLNRRLIDESYAQFDEKAISQRGRDLAELAIQIWPHGTSIIDEGA